MKIEIEKDISASKLVNVSYMSLFHGTSLYLFMKLGIETLNPHNSRLSLLPGLKFLGLCVTLHAPEDVSREDFSVFSDLDSKCWV